MFEVVARPTDIVEYNDSGLRRMALPVPTNLGGPWGNRSASDVAFGVCRRIHHSALQTCWQSFPGQPRIDADLRELMATFLVDLGVSAEASLNCGVVNVDERKIAGRRSASYKESADPQTRKSFVILSTAS